MLMIRRGSGGRVFNVRWVSWGIEDEDLEELVEQGWDVV